MTKPRITLPNTEYDRGFEAGALAALEAITNYIVFGANEPTVAKMVEDAWNSNTLITPAVPARPAPDLSEVP